jgi:hypothetical protein
MSKSLDGSEFKDLFIAGSKRLDESRDYLDSINVFPVPDADTGTNMAATLNNAVEALHDIDDHSLKNVLETIAHKLRMEARGNSGIILSEFFHGMFNPIKGKDEVLPKQFMDALADGKDAAYSALAEPREGTILTLIRQAVEDLKHAEAEISDMRKILEHMVESQRKTLEETKDMMPVLKKNNVVDSGAHGFLLFWEGALAYLNGEIDHVILKPIKKVFKAEAVEQIKYRFCAEGLVRGVSLDKAELQAELINRGDSLIITGDSDLLKIHVHTNEPTVVLDYLGGLGTLVKTKIDDMVDQSREKVAEENKQAVRIVVDSTSDLDLETREELDIEMTPLQVIFGDDIFLDRVNISADEFYHRLKSSKIIPKTSLPNGSDYLKSFEHVDPFCDTILAIYVSSALSGTHQAGVKWGREFSNEKVVTYDSGFASLATGMMAIEAATMAKAGEPLGVILNRLDEIKSKVSIYFTVDTLKFLEKNGRIGKASKFIGSILGLKPILSFVDGEVRSHARAFGANGLMDKVIGQLEADAQKPGFEGNYAVVYSDNPEAHNWLIETMREKLDVKKLYTGQISPVIGAHVGPGALGVMAF